MKYKKHSIYLILLTILLFCGCQDRLFMDREYEMYFWNNADYPISLYSIMIPPYYNTNPMPTVYPDTSLPYWWPSENIIEILPHDRRVYYSTSGDITGRYDDCRSDTISFFVFSTDSLKLLGWDSVRKSYNILQRYDISRAEYVSLGKTCFPPSYAMRNIKMWPPYGTYDTSGHRRY